MITILPLGVIGIKELVLIAVLVLLLFGAKKIPELMRGMGRGIKEFKDAMNKDLPEENDDSKKDKKPE